MLVITAQDLSSEVWACSLILTPLILAIVAQHPPFITGGCGLTLIVPPHSGVCGSTSLLYHGRLRLNIVPPHSGVCGSTLYLAGALIAEPHKTEEVDRMLDSYFYLFYKINEPNHLAQYNPWQIPRRKQTSKPSPSSLRSYKTKCGMPLVSCLLLWLFSLSGHLRTSLTFRESILVLWS